MTLEELNKLVRIEYNERGWMMLYFVNRKQPSRRHSAMRGLYYGYWIRDNFYLVVDIDSLVKGKVEHITPFKTRIKPALAWIAEMEEEAKGRAYEDAKLLRSKLKYSKKSKRVHRLTKRKTLWHPLDLSRGCVWFNNKMYLSSEVLDVLIGSQ